MPRYRNTNLKAKMYLCTGAHHPEHPSPARVHTGFHRFTEISQIFHNKYIFFYSQLIFQMKSQKWFGLSPQIRDASSTTSQYPA